MRRPTDPAFTALYPFAAEYVEHGGLRQHLIDAGAGPAVVMLHGNPTWSFFYRDAVKALAATHRCIVPDHLGCGFSDKPSDTYPYTLMTHIENLERLIESRLGPTEPVSLIVHDWGGAIGMGWATRHPERVSRLVILNTSAFRSPHIPLRINLGRIPGLGRFVIRACNAFARCATFMTTVRPLPPEVKRGFLLPYDSWENRIATHRFVQDIPAHPGIPSYPVLVEIEEKLTLFRETPMLIQWGAKDWCFDLRFYAEWRRRFPAAAAECYEDAGHYLLEDRGDSILPRIAEFLA